MACTCKKGAGGAAGADDGVGKTKRALMQEVSEPVTHSGNKITIVGCGAVGMACAFSILTQSTSSEVALVDMAEEKLMGEMLDLQHGSTFMRNAKIIASTDYAVSAGSKICVVTAGARQNVGETRLDLVQKNTNIMKHIIPQLAKYSPDAVIIMVSNPVDILTYVAWKLSGFPQNRVIGSGTNLDSSRFRVMMSKRLGVAPTSCHAWIIGEHGDSSIAVWSGVNIAGVRIREANPSVGTETDVENWEDIHKQVVNSAYEIIKLKGYTCWAIGLSISRLCQSILRNSGNVHAVSVCVKGLYDIKEDVYFSLPAVLGEAGVTDIIKQPLKDNELKNVQESARLMHEVQSNIQF